MSFSRVYQDIQICKYIFTQTRIFESINFIEKSGYARKFSRRNSEHPNLNISLKPIGAIRRLKHNKTADTNEIIAELVNLRCTNKEKIVTGVWDCELMSCNSILTIVWLIYKGNKFGCSNYRSAEIIGLSSPNIILI